MGILLRPMLGIFGRDLRLKYHSVAGVLFTLLRPWLTVAVLQVVFSRVVDAADGKILDPLSMFAGVVVWNFFSGTFWEGGGSIVANSTLTNRVRFPFVALPLSALVLSWVEALVLLAIWLGLLLVGGRLHLLGLLWGGAFLIQATILVGGLACIASVLNHWYRDLRYLWPLVLQLGFLLTPIGYAVDSYSETSLLFHLNPLAGLIEGLRGVDRLTVVDHRIVYSSWGWSTLIGIIAGFTMWRFERAGRS